MLPKGTFCVLVVSEAQEHRHLLKRIPKTGRFYFKVDLFVQTREPFSQRYNRSVLNTQIAYRRHDST